MFMEREVTFYDDSQKTTCMETVAKVPDSKFDLFMLHYSYTLFHIKLLSL